MEILELFTTPFMQRAFIAGIAVSLLSAVVGVLVVLRRSSFFGDSIGHASLAGVAAGLLLGIDPIWTAVVLAVGLALLLPWMEKKSGLPVDNILGFILPFAMSVGVIILAFLPGYQPELISFLFGNILSVSWGGVAAIVGLSVVILSGMFVFRRQLLASSFDRDYAKILGINTNKFELLFSVFLALSVVVSLKLIGIILVNALLVIPTSTARLWVKSLRGMCLLSPIISFICVLIGISVSIIVNLPTGPTIALVAGTIFVGSIFVRKIGKVSI